MEIHTSVYFPEAAHTAKPVVLLQMAIKLDVLVVITTLTDVVVPNATKKRLFSNPTGNETPD